MGNESKVDQQPQLEEAAGDRKQGGHFSQSLRILIGAAALGITLFTIQSYSGFLVNIIVAAILAILCAPLVGWLHEKGMPRWLALLLTLLVVITVMVALLFFVFHSLNQFGAAIPIYAAELETLKAQFGGSLSSLGAEFPSTAAFIDLVDPTQLVTIVGDIFAGFVSVLGSGITVILTLAFLLFGATGFSAKVERISRQGNPGLRRLFQFNRDIRSYVVITNNAGLAVAAVNTILLLLIGVDFALLWGILSWIMSFVPYIGFVLAMIPPVVLALLEFGWPTALFIVVAYFLINSAMDDVIKPRLMSKGLGIAPVIVFVSVIFWGIVLGPLGGLLAVPMTMGIKQLVLESDPDNRWIADLISNEDDENPEEKDVAA